MHVERFEHRGRALRRQRAGVVCQLAQIVHLLCAQEQIRVHPTFDAVDRPHPHQAAADVDDIQAVAMFYFGNAGRFRRQILPQIHADGTYVGDADRRQPGSVARAARRRMASGNSESTADRKQQRNAARAEKSGNDHRRSER